MAVNAVQFGNIYNVRAIQKAQARPQQGAYTAAAVKDREFHPQVCSTEIGETPKANILDFLA